MYKFFSQYVPAPVAAILAALATLAAKYSGLDLDAIITSFQASDLVVPLGVGAFAYGLRQSPAPEQSQVYNPDDPVTYRELPNYLPVNLGARLAAIEALVLGSAQPRNIRNNNPLNIKHSRSKWRGMANEQGDDVFVTFNSEVYGLRAAAYLLRIAYHQRLKLDTIRKIITRWAPVSDNSTLETDNYIRRVAMLMDKGPDDTIDLTRDDVLVEMIKAMGEVEGGKPLPYAYPKYAEAIALLPNELDVVL